MRLLSAIVITFILLATACIYLPAAPAGSTGQSPIVTSFEASPNVIEAGERSQLTWNVIGANTVNIDNGIGPVALRGTRIITPGTTTIYSLTASNSSGSANATVQVVVGGIGGLQQTSLVPVINWFTASPAIVSLGGTSVLSWNISNATSVLINPGLGDVNSVSGSKAVSPAVTTNYTLTAKNSAGSSTSITTVNITGTVPGSALPVINVFEAVPSSVRLGGSLNLNWNVSNASNVTIIPGSGSMLVAGPVGSIVVSPTTTTTYTLQTTNINGMVSRTITVMVGESGSGTDLTSPSIPNLLIPQESATLPQPSSPWNFDWSDSTDPESDIQGYQVYVIKSGALTPAIDTTTSASNYSVTLGGLIGQSDLLNWSWKVRAQNNAGLWSDWSLTRTFKVQGSGNTVNLGTVSNETGTVHRDGTVAVDTKFAGDTTPNVAMRCYFSYDISALSGKNVESARLSFVTNSIVRNPFGNLGSLSIGRVNYGAGLLEAADYAIPSSSLVSVSAPPGELDVTTYIKNAVLASDPRFQIRLQFAYETNGDNLSDYINFSSAVLTVTYSN